MHALLLTALASIAATGGAPAIKTIDLRLHDRAAHLAMHCIAPSRRTTRAVLFVHGATFPTRLAAGFEFERGDSWMHFMAAQGYLACGLDFLGFGASSRPAALRGAAAAAPPLTRATEAADEIAVAADHLRRVRGIDAVHLVAHSWGTIPAASYAARRPEGLASLTLFGPIVPAASGEQDPVSRDAWFALTAQQRLRDLRFESVLPPGRRLLEPQVEARWATEFVASAAHEANDAPDRIRIPNGPNVDIAEAAAGRYPYDPKAVDVPVCVVYGNYDVVLDDTGAAAFLARFTGAPLRWRLRIDEGTHVMHLERQRRSLYESVAAFVRAAVGVGS